jgi:hypothetical protein
MLKKEGLLNVKRVDSQYIVEAPQAEEAAPPAEPVLQPEDALAVLFKALKVIDENDLWGQLSYSAVRDYVQRLDPDFDEKRYGFAQFAELLNYAQDCSLVRLEPDADEVWRVFPGIQFTPSRAVFSTAAGGGRTIAPPAQEPLEPTAEAAAGMEGAPEELAPGPKGRRRSYHRRGGRGRARPPRRPPSQPAPAEP